MGGGPAEGSPSSQKKQEELLILLSRPEPKETTDRIRARFPHLKVTYQTPPSGTIPASTFANTTILCTFNSLPQDPSHDAPHLELVHFFSAGTNHVSNQPIYTSSDVTLTTSSGVHGPQIAEWVVMTALVQSHKYNLLHDLQKQHQWGKEGMSRELNKSRDMVGQRVGVLGYGSIGRQVGRVAKAMGMSVYAYTASAKESKESRRDQGFVVPGTGDVEGAVPEKWFSGLEKEKLHEFLKQDLDWIVVCVPLTKETTHFLGKEEFEILGRKNAMVTNISRGAILDQKALIEALKDGTLRGAALDVTDPEPLPEDSELWGMESVIVTPHISGLGQAYTDRALQILEVNLERREKGEKLINVVNRKRGY